jgi:DNA-binding beta-propeller fold protein YncE
MRQRMHGFSFLLLVQLTAPALLVSGCKDGDDGGFPGAGDLRLLVATQGPDALELFDAQTFEDALGSPTGLPAAPVEARADREREVFVAAFADNDARAFDSRLFEEIPGSEMSAGGFVAFDGDNDRIYLAEGDLAFFDARDFSPLGFPPIDLEGEASDLIYDPATQRVFVAVTAPGGPLLRVYGADNLAEVPPSPIDLPGGAGVRTGDLLLVEERGELFVLLPQASQLAAVDPASLQPLPRTPVDLRVAAASLARDPERERLYAASADGRLDAVGATDFSLQGGFPRTIAESVADLAFDPETERLFAADSAEGEVVVLDAVTLEDEADSPIPVGGRPVSVEILDLRAR